MAFLERSEQPIELSSLEIGGVHIVHLPGEPMIGFQLFAQGLKPADFVAVAGYGDCRDRAISAPSRRIAREATSRPTRT